MSNVTLAEIIDLVAKAYGVAPASFCRQPPGTQISPAMREARAVVLILGLKHTLFQGRSITDAMGLSYNGDLLRRLTEEAERFTAALAADPQRQSLLEGVEQGIDHIHEGRDTLRQTWLRQPKTKQRSSKSVATLRSITVDDLSERWWAENDLRFRWAILSAAEINTCQDTKSPLCQ